MSSFPGQRAGAWERGFSFSVSDSSRVGLEVRATHFLQLSHDSPSLYQNASRETLDHPPCATHFQRDHLEVITNSIPQSHISQGLANCYRVRDHLQVITNSIAQAYVG